MKIAGILSYLGQAYEGFQRQKEAPSIQGKLEEVLSLVAGEPIEIKAAGRTDAKVNAIGQVFAFHLKRKVKLDHYKNSLNRLLPKDIAVLKLVEVPDSFDPRHSAAKKEYVYRFYYGDKDPFKKDTYAYFGTPRFNPNVFAEALQIFLGEHDFSNFTSKEQDKDNFIRFLERIDCRIDEKKKEGEVTFLANGFMTYQIRYMVGAAYQVAYGKRSLEEIKAMLTKKPRHVSVLKADPCGLTLVKVYYDEELGL